LKITDTTLAVLSDMHTGGSTALFPLDGYKGESDEDNQVLPNPKQKEMRSIYVRFSGEVAKARKDRRLIVVMLGDAIDGVHHDTLQLSLHNEKDQCEAHLKIMHDFLGRVSFRKNDELYYVKGTEVHVKENERNIAKELKAVKSENGTHIHDVLTLPINGMTHVFAHHGKKRGSGQNEGNALRNFLRDIRADREKDGLQRIDVLWSGHTHGHTWNTHIERHGGEFHEMHGIVCPSWQAKTRYAYGKVAMAVNSIGGVYVNVSVDGEMSRPHFVVQTTKDV